MINTKGSQEEEKKQPATNTSVKISIAQQVASSNGETLPKSKPASNPGKTPRSTRSAAATINVDAPQTAVSKTASTVPNGAPPTRKRNRLAAGLVEAEVLEEKVSKKDSEVVTSELPPSNTENEENQPTKRVTRRDLRSKRPRNE